MEPSPAPTEEPVAVDELQKEILFSFAASKKGKKKSKLAAKRAVFESD